jgi:putative ABC transport system permease protein
VPLTTADSLLGGTHADANDYWVRTTSQSHPFIDRTVTHIEDRLSAHGYDVDGEVKYVELANEVASDRTDTTMLALVGFLIVLISMSGLANALTTSVLERTREIGLLRSIGARAPYRTSRKEEVEPVEPRLSACNWRKSPSRRRGGTEAGPV